jgi:hypothetical protein
VRSMAVGETDSEVCLASNAVHVRCTFWPVFIRTLIWQWLDPPRRQEPAEFSAEGSDQERPTLTSNNKQKDVSYISYNTRTGLQYSNSMEVSLS